MDLSHLTALSRLIWAVIGAAAFGLVAVIGGAVMMFALRRPSVRNNPVAQQIFARVSPAVFYFGMVAPVWALMGAALGYQYGGGR